MHDTFGIYVGSGDEAEPKVPPELMKKISEFATEKYTVISAEPLRSGAYNWVVKAVLHVHRSDRDSYDPKTVVYRFPKDWKPETPDARYSIRDQAATHTFLRERQHSFHVPEIIEYDIGWLNQFEHPYMMMEYVPSVALVEIYPLLPVEYKMQIAQQLVEILASLQSITFNQAGALKATRTYHDHHKEYRNELVANALTVDCFKLSEDDITFETEAVDGLEELFASKLAGYIALEKEWMAVNGHTEDSEPMQRLKQLLTVANRVKELGFFDEDPPQPNVVCHWDLLPRNLLVKVHPDFDCTAMKLHPDAYFDSSKEAPGTLIKIVSVIDWDNTASLPAVLAHVPPMWLWDFTPAVSSELDLTPNGSLGPFWDGRDPDLYPQDYYDRDSGVLTEANQMLKEYFDRMVEERTPGYTNNAYGTKGRLHRKLWRFLKNGVHGQGDSLAYFMREWDIIEKTYMPEDKREIIMNGNQEASGVTREERSQEPETKLKTTSVAEGDTPVNQGSETTVVGTRDLDPTSAEPLIIDWAALMDDETTSNNIKSSDEPIPPTQTTVANEMPVKKKSSSPAIPTYRSLIPKHEPANANILSKTINEHHLHHPKPSAETQQRRIVSYPAEQLSNLLDESLDLHSPRMSVDFTACSIADSTRQFIPAGEESVSDVDRSSSFSPSQVRFVTPDTISSRGRSPIEAYLGGSKKSSASTKTSRLSTMGSMIKLLATGKKDDKVIDNEVGSKTSMKENYTTKIKRFFGKGD